MITPHSQPAAPKPPRLLLASGSPRRQDFLREAAIPFDVWIPEVDEHEPAEGEAPNIVLLNAHLKAKAGRSRFPNHVILASDTTVALGRHIFNKPVDRDDALAMLMRLNARTHSVFTAVVILPVEGEPVCLVEESKVTFRQVSSEELLAYIDAARPFDKAGAYGIQDPENTFVKAFTGYLSTIIGLPIESLLPRLVALGIRPQAGPAKPEPACPSST